MAHSRRPALNPAPNPALIPARTTVAPDGKSAADAGDVRSNGGDDRLLLRFAGAACIVLAVLWIYSRLTDLVFIPDWLWDDDTLLTANATVQSTTAASLVRIWTGPTGADYFPLTTTAFWLQWPLFGPWSAGYHLVSVVLHALGSLLLWRLLAGMKVPGAWLAAAIFAVHPVCVESVAWVAELKNTLSLPLFLLAAIHYTAFDRIVAGRFLEDGPEEGRAMLHYLASLVLFLLAMFAKTSMVMLPPVLLLHAWWRRGRVTLADAVWSAPFFLVSLVLGIITITFQHGRAIGVETINVGGLDSRIATAGMSVLWYLRILAWPEPLLPIYPRWEVDPPRAWQFLTWLPILGGLWACWVNRDAEGPRRFEGWGRHALFAAGFFLLMVAPVLGFITISYMRITWAADHFIYLPMIGPVALVSAALVTATRGLPASSRPVLYAGVTSLLAFLTVTSHRYAGVWFNEDLLWTHTLEHNPDAWQAHNRLGARKFSRQHIDDIPPVDDIRGRGAFYHFTRATALRPDLGETHNNLGLALSSKGRLAEAVEQFIEADRVTPNSPTIRINLANGQFALSRFAEAGAIYEELLLKAPDSPPLLNNLGVTLYRRGRIDEAVKLFRRALERDPTLKDAQDSLAIALGEKPDPFQASQQPGAEPTAAAGEGLAPLGTAPPAVPPPGKPSNPGGPR